VAATGESIEVLLETVVVHIDNCCVREFLCEERRDLHDEERFRVRDL
jgi:hypothetical protein